MPYNRLIWKAFYRVYILMSLILLGLGLFAQSALGSSVSSFAPLIGIGTGIMIFALSGYVPELCRSGRRTLWLYIVGTAFLVMSITLILSSVFYGSKESLLAIAGLSAFSISFYTITLVTLLKLSISNRKTLIYGILLFAFGLPTFILFGLRPPYQNYDYLSVLPLLAGAMLIVIGKFGLVNRIFDENSDGNFLSSNVPRH